MLSPVHLKLVKTFMFTASVHIRILNDSKDWALTVSVGRRFHSLISDGEKAKLSASTLQYGTRYLVMSSCSRCADRLKNSGCRHFNKMINNSIHQDHLSMFSVSVEIFPAKISCSIHCLFVRNLLVGFHKHVEVIFIRPSFLQVCRRNDR